jgi:starvation-inducible DNA-binding protein
MSLNFEVPGLDDKESEKAVKVLQHQLVVLNDLALTLKHAHWNVKGPRFIAVHEMLDPQIDKVRDFVDEVAERIATLGGSPNGRSEALQTKGYGEYPLDRDGTQEHIEALNKLYVVVISGVRKAIAELDEVDVISSNIMQDVTQELELFQWFLRSHLI